MKTNLYSNLVKTENPFKESLLDEMSKFATASTQILSDLLATFQRQEGSVQLIYGLDFDIIYSYANPWANNSELAKIVKYVIENDETPFTLLPGTVEELWNYLDYTTQKRNIAKSLKDRIIKEKPSEVIVECVKQLIKTSSLGEQGKSIACDLNMLAKLLLDLEERYNYSISKIEYLLNSPKMRKLKDIYADANASTYQEDVFNNLFIRLTTIRRGEKNRNKNKSDAKNLATVVQHTHLEAVKFGKSPIKRRCKVNMLRLLTNTNYLLNLSLPEYNDIATQEVARTLRGVNSDIGHSLAVRSSIEAAYATAMICVNAGRISDCRKMASKAIRVLNIASMRFDAVDDEIRNNKYYVVSQLNALDEIMNQIDEEVINEKYTFNCWYDTIRKLLFDVGAEYGLKSQFRESPENWWENEASFSELAYSQYNLLRTPYIIQANSIIRLANPDKEKNELEFLGIHSQDVELVGVNAPKRWVVLINNNNLIFLLDKFDKTHYISWPSKINLHEIVENIVQLDNIFRHSSIINYKGQIIIEIGLSNIVTLCDLPLKSKIDNKDIVNKLTKSEGNEVPSKVVFETEDLTIVFDIYNYEHNEHILAVFNNKLIYASIIDVFANTSNWRSESKYFEKLTTLIRTSIHKRIMG